MPQEKIRRRVDEAFSVFHLERLKNRNVYELSSGERQLISILSAWALDTDIFLLDEPTANLDFAATQQLKKYPARAEGAGQDAARSASTACIILPVSQMNTGSWRAARSKKNTLPMRRRRSHRSGCMRSPCARLTLIRFDVPERASQLPEAPTGAFRLKHTLYIRPKGADPILTGHELFSPGARDRRPRRRERLRENDDRQAYRRTV